MLFVFLFIVLYSFSCYDDVSMRGGKSRPIFNTSNCNMSVSHPSNVPRLGVVLPKSPCTNSLIYLINWIDMVVAVLKFKIITNK